MRISIFAILTALWTAPQLLTAKPPTDSPQDNSVGGHIKISWYLGQCGRLFLDDETLLSRDEELSDPWNLAQLGIEQFNERHIRLFSDVPLDTSDVHDDVQERHQATILGMASTIQENQLRQLERIALGDVTKFTHFFDDRMDNPRFGISMAKIREFSEFFVSKRPDQITRRGAVVFAAAIKKLFEGSPNHDSGNLILYHLVAIRGLYGGSDYFDYGLGVTLWRIVTGGLLQRTESHDEGLQLMHDYKLAGTKDITVTRVRDRIRQSITDEYYATTPKSTLEFADALEHEIYERYNQAHPDIQLANNASMERSQLWSLIYGPLLYTHDKMVERSEEFVGPAYSFSISPKELSESLDLIGKLLPLYPDHRILARITQLSTLIDHYRPVIMKNSPSWIAVYDRFLNVLKGKISKQVLSRTQIRLRN